MKVTSDIADTPLGLLNHGVRSQYVSDVAERKRKTPQRTLVIDPAQWDELGRNAQLAGSERAVVLRAFVAWYNRTPGARLPQRPGE